MSELGNKVRQLRLKLGMSQRQLAGSEMTPAFICMIESGQSHPSYTSLQLIAQRLGKPPAYFLDSGQTNTCTQKLLRVIQQLHREKRWEDAAAECRILLNRDPEPETEAETRLLLARSLQSSNVTEAKAEYARALAIYRQLKSRKGEITCLCELARCAMNTECFHDAYGLYKELLGRTIGAKRWHNVRAKAYCYLGSSCYRLGLLGEAETAYAAAIEDAGNYLPLITAEAKLGLGWVKYKLGAVEEAKEYTADALAMMQQQQHPATTMARQNLAIILNDLGWVSTAEQTLRDCLVTYQKSGNTLLAASVMEELAHLAAKQGQLEGATDVCWSALDLMDESTGAIQRGRLYRLLGSIFLSQHEYKKARECLRLSADLLRPLGTTAELQETLNLLDHAKYALAQGECNGSHGEKKRP